MKYSSLFVTTHPDRTNLYQNGLSIGSVIEGKFVPHQHTRPDGSKEPVQIDMAALQDILQSIQLVRQPDHVDDSKLVFSQVTHDMARKVWGTYTDRDLSLLSGLNYPDWLELKQYVEEEGVLSERLRASIYRPIGSDKGTRNGICNIGICNNGRAIHLNRITNKYYCTPCARKLNEVAQHDDQPLCSWPSPQDLDSDGLLLNEPVSLPVRYGISPKEHRGMYFGPSTYTEAMEVMGEEGDRLWRLDGKSDGLVAVWHDGWKFQQ